MTKTSEGSVVKPAEGVVAKSKAATPKLKVLLSPFSGTVIEGRKIVGKGTRNRYRVTAGDPKSPLVDLLVESVDESEAIRLAVQHAPPHGLRHHVQRV